MRKYDYIQLQY